MRKDVDKIMIKLAVCAKLDEVEHESAMTQPCTFKFQLLTLSFLALIFNYF